MEILSPEPVLNIIEMNNKNKKDGQKNPKKSNPESTQQTKKGTKIVIPGLGEKFDIKI